jgi:hypothetical protein
MISSIYVQEFWSVPASGQGDRDERGIALELMYRHGDASQARIGEIVGLDYTAVSQERTRLRDRIESDKRLKKRLIEIEASLLS